MPSFPSQTRGFEVVLKKIQKLIKPLASLKLAVLIILALGVISSWGTIVESQTDARTAQKLVYHSVYMYGIMVLLCVCLIAVMIDRLPWKSHHAGFILAHVGIITVLIGSYITYRFGIDGSMVLKIGEGSRVVDLQDRQISVYSYFNGVDPELIFQEDVDFLLNPVSGARSKKFQWTDQSLEVIDFYNFANREEKIEETDKSNDGPAIRFQLANERVSFSKWLRVRSFSKEARLNLGPAEVVLSQQPKKIKYKTGNMIFLTPDSDPQRVQYAIYTKSQGGLVKKGRLRLGDTINTGWMGLRFRVLNYFRHSTQRVKFTQTEQPTKLTTSAVKIRFNKKEFWLGLNSLYRFFNEKQAHLVVYGNKRLSLGFDIQLKKFKVGHYQGTQRASSYESRVFLDGVGESVISMNNPLKHGGFTFYQASFNKDEQGQPNASILSVNWDPGRFLKYLGCLMIVLGTIVLFFFRRKQLNFYKKFFLKRSAR